MDTVKCRKKSFFFFFFRSDYRPTQSPGAGRVPSGDLGTAEYCRGSVGVFSPETKHFYSTSARLQAVTAARQLGTTSVQLHPQPRTEELRGAHKQAMEADLPWYEVK